MHAPLVLIASAFCKHLQSLTACPIFVIFHILYDGVYTAFIYYSYCIYVNSFKTLWTPWVSAYICI